MFTLLYFAAVRERLGRDRDAIHAAGPPPPPTVEDLWAWLTTAHPELIPWRRHLRFAVNQELCDPAHPVADGDEIAIIPPVSGGQDAPTDLASHDGAYRITSLPLDARAAEALVAHSGAGGLVTFTGSVRDHTADHVVSYLIYEAYAPMALRSLATVGAEITAHWPTARIAIHHRVGRLELGDAAVVVAVSTPHRAEAFAACQHAIDRLKQLVPIWKKEVGPGGQEWVGMGP
jgi:molybdopterin synthase catalytic subunit